MAIQVRAKAQGYYGNQLREPGQVFEISKEKELGSWMVKLSDEAKANKAPAKTDDGKADDGKSDGDGALA